MVDFSKYLKSGNDPVCRKCALAKGWKPTNKVVGNWVDVCSFCKTEQSCCAVRDWVNQELKMKNMKIKLVNAYDFDKFESALNDALSQLDGEVIDIKYSVASAFNGTVAADMIYPTFPTLETYSALILYKQVP